MLAMALVRAADVVVSLPEKPHDLVAAAGEDLRRYLAEMTGREAVIAPADQRAALRVALSVDGTLERELGPEGFYARSDGSTVTLTGVTPLAAQHAVYAFLERLGCRWFFPGKAWEDLPELTSLTLPTLDEKSRPDYQMRRIWYGWGIGPIPENAVAYRDWVKQNRMGGALTGSTGHAYAGIARDDLHYQDHPDWFPLLNGKRVRGGQLCISHPAIRERAIQRAREFFKARPDIMMLSMSPNDGAGWCQCERCAKLGSVTDQALWLANQAADAIRDEFPGKLISMYGYAGTSTPPNIEAAPNVIIFIATAFNRVGFAKSLEGWSKKCTLIGIRDYYNVIIWNRDMPRWQVDRMRKNIPHFHEKGAIAINAESGNEWAAEGLNYYVAAKLMWDTKADVDKLLDDFFERCWGKAAVPMRRYYERFKTERMSSRTLAACLRDLAEASALAKRAKVIERLDMFKLYLHWVRLYYEHNTAKGSDAATAAARKALHFAWRVRTTNMIHSYAQFRERRIWRIARRTPALEVERWKRTDKPVPAPDAPQDELPDPDALHAGAEAEEDEVDQAVFETKKPEEQEPTGPPPMFTHDEIEAMFLDDLKAYQGTIEIDSGQQFSTDLVPIPAGTPGVRELKKVGSPKYRGTNSFVLRASQPGPFPVQLHPGHVRRRTGTYWLFRLDEPDEAIAEGKVEGAEPYTLELNLPAAGLYRLVFSLGGMAARIGFGKQHAVWQLARGTGAHVISGSGRQYFYVPKGTRSFALGLATPDGHGQVTIRGPHDKVHLQKAGNYAPGQEFAVVVPEGLDGAVWSFSIGRCEDAAGIFLLGVPPYASMRPGMLLVPQESIEK